MAEKDPLLAPTTSSLATTTTTQSYNSLHLPTRAGKEKTTTVRYYDNAHVGCLTRWRRRRALERYNAKRRHLEELYAGDDDYLFEHKDSATVSDIRRWDGIMSTIYFISNLLLLAINISSSVLTGSLSVASAVLDAAMDLSTSVIMSCCIFLVRKTNSHMYPRGRARLELLGVIVSSGCMAAANAFMVTLAGSSIVLRNVNIEMNLFVVGIMVVTVFWKLTFMVLCYRIGSPALRVLALDMRNDVFNQTVATAGAFVGLRWWEYADPIAAIIVCCFVAFAWMRNALSHIPLLVGVRAEQEQLSRILRIAMTHDSRIRCIDHILVYHTSEQALVELHIVMDENMPLKTSHDIGHLLEKKLNTLDFVERAFVHSDFECDGDGTTV